MATVCKMEGDINIMALMGLLVAGTALTVAFGYVAWYLQGQAEEPTGFGINPMTWLIIAVILIFVFVIYMKGRK